MAKKALLIVFAIECVVLAILLCREWTLYYIGGGHAETEYQSVYRDKIDAGHHPVTADIDAETTSFVVWWGGAICIFFGVALGGPLWAYQQLWPERTPHHAGGVAPPDEWEYTEDASVAADADELFGDECEDARAM